MSRYLNVYKTFRPILVTDEDGPDTERRPELAEAWATVMNGYIEFADADPLTFCNAEAIVEDNGAAE